MSMAILATEVCPMTVRLLLRIRAFDGVTHLQLVQIKPAQLFCLLVGEQVYDAINQAIALHRQKLFAK